MDGIFVSIFFPTDTMFASLLNPSILYFLVKNMAEKSNDESKKPSGRIPGQIIIFHQHGFPWKYFY